MARVQSVYEMGSTIIVWRGIGTLEEELCCGAHAPLPSRLEMIGHVATVLREAAT